MARYLIPGDTSIKTIKPGDPRKRLSDGDGLYLLLFVKGGAHGWRFDYAINERRKTLSLGTYPATSLALARKKADEARALVSEGIDPSEVRKVAKTEAQRQKEDERRTDAGLPAVDSFEAVAVEWYGVKRGEWSASYGEKVIARLKVDVFPYMGRAKVAEISPAMVLEVLRRIEARGVRETAHRALESCSQIMRYAVQTQRAISDPCRDLKGALLKPMAKHFPAITKPERLGDLLRASEGYAGSVVVRAALKLAPMLMLRPGELRHAQWHEFDLQASTWMVPAARMKRTQDGKKNGDPHYVPLPIQAVTVLEDLHHLTGHGLFVFMGERHHDRPMSENTVNAALRAMGFANDEMTGHGFRATARTLLHERLGIAPEVIEAQLAHSVQDSLGRAYNRTEFIAQRKAMMQTLRWSNSRRHKDR